MEESYAKFKTFLASYFIRKANGEYDPDDFKKDNYEHIQPHLQELFSHLTWPEACRIKTYFHSAFRFHLNNALKRPNIPPGHSITSEVIDEDQDGTESPQENIIETQPELVNEPGISSQPFAQVDTPLASVDTLRSRMTTHFGDSITPIDPLESVEKKQPRHTLPLMQSTPLTEAGMILDQQHLQTLEEEHNFANDVISQINMSTIPGPSVTTQKRVQFQRRAVSPKNVESSVPFLDKFTDIDKVANSSKQTSTPRTRTRPRNRPIVQPIVREPKKKFPRMKFEELCSLPLKKKTEAQLKEAQDSYLHFPLMPGKTRNLIKRIMDNTVIPEGEKGHISMQRVQNLSNVLRAHASQRQSSVEQPLQFSSTRSPCPTKALLRRSSSFLPFNPLHEDISGQTPRTEIDPYTLPSLYQQPLLPIPERDSSIDIPTTSPVVEAVHRNNSTINIPSLPECVSEIPLTIHEDVALSSSIPRAVPENVETISQQLLQITLNESSQTQTQQQEIPLMNIQPLFEQELPSHSDQQHSYLPQMVSEDFDISGQRPQVDSIFQQGLPICSETPIATDAELVPDVNPSRPLSELVGQQPLLSGRDDEAVPLFQPIAQAEVANIERDQEDDTRTNWYEILRSRADFTEYPQEGATKRRKRRRKRRRNDNERRDVSPRLANELPDIPPSPPRENRNSVQMPALQESMDLGQLNVPMQVGDSNLISDQFPQNQEPMNLGTSNVEINDNVLLVTPSDQMTTTIDGIPHQNTQGSENETSLKKRYLELIKEAGRKIDYDNWDHFDAGLFNQDDNFELYTQIFKRIIKEDYVQMDTLYGSGTTRLEAAKALRFVMELKKMGIIEIDSIETKILGFRLKPTENIQES